MATKIEKTLGTAPKLIPKEGGIFDVFVGNELVYSKFQTGSFPNEKRLIDEMVSNYGKAFQARKN